MFRFDIVAKDNHGRDPYQQATYPVTINVEDVDDMPPEFVRVPSVTRIKENSEKGTPVLVVSAVDGDRIINAPIRYAIIEGNNNDTFTIKDNKTGSVTIQTSPDREALKGDIGFTIWIQAEEYANDTAGKSANVSCTVIVEDVNDSPPKFTYDKYEATIEENSPFGIAVKLTSYDFIEVTDADERNHAGFALTLTDDPNALFEIKPSKGVLRESFVIQLVNNELLDFETLTTNPVIIKLIATDNSDEDPKPNFISNATVTITVTDANDNFPVFSTSLYEASIPESSAEDTFVVQVQATDKDTGDFGTKGIWYSISGISEQFQIDKLNGKITVKNGKLLDREQNAHLFLTVEAKDNKGKGNGNTSQVAITLTDINDNAPEFVYSSYKAILEENKEEFQIMVEIKATDKDEGVNQEIDYTIFKTKSEDYFHLTKSSELKEYQLLPKTPLDYEAICPGQQKTCPLEVIVVATDRGVFPKPLSSNTTVYITFLDTNDEHPKFTKALSNIAINETAPGGTFIVQVTANDEDVTDEFRRISYQITEGDSSLFSIKQDGTITTGLRAQLQLSKTQMNSYNLTVMASDGAINADESESMCRVIIDINDVNNEAPEFSSAKYKAFILENATKGSFLECEPAVNATDMDSNSQLVYSLTYKDAEAIGPDGDDVEDGTYENLFKIDSSGQVYVYTELDRETISRLIMTLQVIDENAETEMPEQTATATLTVTIGDVNDNAPDFEEHAYYGSVIENTRIGTKIEPIVKATDKDYKQKMTYTLDGDETYLELVNISKTDGRLTVRSNIDREKIPQFEVLVVATDNGSPPLSSNVTFNITVIDVNDNAPKFEPESYALFIGEDAKIGSSLVKVSANDLDEGDYGTVMYIFPDGVSDFAIDSITGEITVRAQLDCDYVQDHSEDPTVTVPVHARDNKNVFPYQVGVTTVNITITDVNDNVPVIIITANVSVSEDRKVNEVLATIKATDPDKGDNGTVELYLDEDAMEPRIKGLFQINMTVDNSGDFFVQNSLLGVVGYFDVFIKAHDNGNPRLTSNSSRLVVRIIDVNDHSPEFHVPLENQQFRASLDLGRYRITKINVTDDDYDDNGKINFKLLKYTDKFEIVEDTNGLAELYLKDNIEQQGRVDYKVPINACDAGVTIRCTIRTIQVTVTDVSEHPPKFDKPTNTTVTFTEEQDGNSETNPLPLATDEDNEGEAKQGICYYIVGGNAENKFVVQEEHNTLTTNEVLDRESQDSYTLYVFATNQCGNPPGSLTVNDDLSKLNDSYLQVNIEVEDINDNPPTFGSKLLFTGGVDNTDDPGKRILQISATDPDIGENGAIYYYKTGNVRKHQDVNMGTIENIDNCFIVESTTGGITTGCTFGVEMKGYLEFSVLANNSGQVVTRNGFITQNATTSVKIYVLRADQKLRFQFYSTPEAFRTIKDKFVSKLEKILGVTVNLDEVQIYKDDKTEKEDSSKSEVLAHFVDPETNEVLDPEAMQAKLDELGGTHRNELNNEFQVMNIGNKPSTSSPDNLDPKKLQEILMIAAAGVLGTILVVLLTAYCVRVNKLERKLKAATTDAYDNNAATDSPLEDMPTTNQTTGLNPLYNYEFDGNDPRLFESNDTDSVSAQSLVEDSNDFDGGKNNGGFAAMMETYFQEEPTKIADEIEMKNQLNSNFSMQRPDDAIPTSDNFILKPCDDNSPFSDNFILKPSEDILPSSDNFILKKRDEDNPPMEI